MFKLLFFTFFTICTLTGSVDPKENKSKKEERTNKPFIWTAALEKWTIYVVDRHLITPYTSRQRIQPHIDEYSTIWPNQINTNFIDPFLIPPTYIWDPVSQFQNVEPPICPKCKQVMNHLHLSTKMLF